MKKINSPGICSPDPANLIKVFNKVINFIGSDIQSPCADLSPPNIKANSISLEFNMFIEPIFNMDYDMDKLGTKKYKTILCFEIIEHLRNPYLFLKNIKDILTNDGVLYLSYPSRIKLEWPDFHYNEIPKERFKKWLIEPLGLKIEKEMFIRSEKKIRWKHFIGVRPLIRLFYLPWNGANIYKITKC